jgi:hypothetical protein
VEVMMKSARPQRVAMTPSIATVVAATAVVLAAFPVTARASGRLTFAGPGTQPVEVAYQRVDTVIVNHAVTTRVRQKFSNSTDRVQEGEYTFIAVPESEKRALPEELKAKLDGRPTPVVRAARGLQPPSPARPGRAARPRGLVSVEWENASVATILEDIATCIRRSCAAARTSASASRSATRRANGRA